MKKDNQLSFATYEASLKLSSNDPIKQIFDSIDWSFIYPLVKDKYSDLGREGFDPVSLFKAQLLIYLGEVKSDRGLASSLNFNTRHCLLCGFNSFLNTPTHGVFSQFRKRLGEETFYHIFRKIIGQAIVLSTIKGTDVAIDSTHIIAYSNRFGVKTCNCIRRCRCERVPSDPDARVGAKSETHFFFGYKVHMLVDGATQLPIEVTVTPGDSADSPYLIPLVMKVKDNHPKLKIKNASADAAYDAYENYSYLVEEEGINPFIALNIRNEKESIPLGKLKLQAPDGKYLCQAGFEAVNWGYEKKRRRLKLRCPAALGRELCLFRNLCSSSSYGRTFYIYPDKELRLVGPIPRGTSAWQKNYSNRTATERANSELKQEHRLNTLRVRGLPNVKIHVFLSLTAQALKRIARILEVERVRPVPVAL